MDPQYNALNNWLNNNFGFGFDESTPLPVPPPQRPMDRVILPTAPAIQMHRSLWLQLEMQGIRKVDIAHSILAVVFSPQQESDALLLLDDNEITIAVLDYHFDGNMEMADPLTRDDIDCLYQVIPPLYRAIASTHRAIVESNQGRQRYVSGVGVSGWHGDDLVVFVETFSTRTDSGSPLIL